MRCTDREPTDRVLTVVKPTNLKGRQWVVLRADLNWRARVQGHNTRERAECQKKTHNGQGLK